MILVPKCCFLVQLTPTILSLDKYGQPELLANEATRYADPMSSDPAEMGRCCLCSALRVQMIWGDSLASLSRSNTIDDCGGEYAIRISFSKQHGMVHPKLNGHRKYSQQGQRVNSASHLPLFMRHYFRTFNPCLSGTKSLLGGLHYPPAVPVNCTRSGLSR